ncbi:MAG: thioesterase family protein [Terriglobales bacterium]
MAKVVPLGTRGEVVAQVELRHTLQHHLEWLPPVLSTPNMIGWMEMACFEAAAAFCDEGEITVGTAINVLHRAPTGVGSKVVAEAVLERIEGKFHIFRVTARDETQQIGEGTVSRAFVNVDRFLQKPGMPTAKRGT